MHLLRDISIGALVDLMHIPAIWSICTGLVYHRFELRPTFVKYTLASIFKHDINLDRFHILSLKSIWWKRSPEMHIFGILVLILEINSSTPPITKDPLLFPLLNINLYFFSLVAWLLLKGICPIGMAWKWKLQICKKKSCWHTLLWMETRYL